MGDDQSQAPTCCVGTSSQARPQRPGTPTLRTAGGHRDPVVARRRGPPTGGPDRHADRDRHAVNCPQPRSTREVTNQPRITRQRSEPTHERGGANAARRPHAGRRWRDSRPKNPPTLNDSWTTARLGPFLSLTASGQQSQTRRAERKPREPTTQKTFQPTFPGGSWNLPTRPNQRGIRDRTQPDNSTHRRTPRPPRNLPQTPTGHNYDLERQQQHNKTGHRAIKIRNSVTTFAAAGSVKPETTITTTRKGD